MSEFRYELKFVLNESQLSHLLFLIKLYGFKKHHPKRTINSIYFEDFNFSSLKDNLSGISKRKKIRLRWYKNDDTAPLLEIKKRSGRVGNKLRLSTPFNNGNQVENMTSKEIYNILNTEKSLTTNLFIQPHFRPLLYVCYDREYLISHEGIRLTIDKKIKFSSVSLYDSINSKKLYSYNKNVIEIKFPLEAKKFLDEILTKTGLIPSRHSKYLIGTSILGISSYI